MLAHVGQERQTNQNVPQMYAHVSLKSVLAHSVSAEIVTIRMAREIQFRNSSRAQTEAYNLTLTQKGLNQKK